MAELKGKVLPLTSAKREECNTKLQLGAVLGE